MAVDKLVDSNQLNADLTSVANAIRTKGGTSDPLAFPNGFVSAVNAIPTGGSESVGRKDINFIDYDGTIVKSYTAAEFADLEALPDNPEHDGLTAQGWNWTLADAKAYVAKCGKLFVGQMYVTDDGKTRIYIHLEQGRLAPYLGIAINGSAVVDWGDNSTPDTITGSSDSTVVNTQHTYAAAGDYVITIAVTGSMALIGNNGSCLLYKNSATKEENDLYRNVIKKIEIGSNVTSIGSNAFASCYSLATVTIPDGVTSIGDKAFDHCYSLAAVAIPNSVSSIGTYAFSYCQSLTSVTIPNSVSSIGKYTFDDCSSLAAVTIPDSVTSIEMYAFAYCRSLTSVTIPDSVTSIGNNTFAYCHSLTSVTIPDSVTSIGIVTFAHCYSLASVTISDGVTSIANNTFANCYSLASVTIPDGVTSIGSGAFDHCYSLASVTIPDGVTSIGSNAFASCYSLATVTIPDGVTSIGNAFANCYSLASVTIPDGVTSIGSGAFAGCYGMAEIHFLPTTPPVSSNAAFTYLPKDCIIYVPTGSLNAYTSTKNYPSSKTYTYVEE